MAAPKSTPTKVTDVDSIPNLIIDCNTQDDPEKLIPSSQSGELDVSTTSDRRLL